jgi:hypothetical protein
MWIRLSQTLKTPTLQPPHSGKLRLYVQGGGIFLRHEALLSVALIVIIAACAYLPLVGDLGLYFGDSAFLWFGHQSGAGALVSALSDDRPFSGVVFALHHALLDTNVIAWHLTMFAWRVGGGLALLWGLRALWPERRGLMALAALLAVLYPGYLFQTMANNLQNYLVGWTLALLSIAATIRAVRSPHPMRRRAYTALALVTCAAYLVILELLVGLEALRFAVLWGLGAPDTNGRGRPRPSMDFVGTTPALSEFDTPNNSMEVTPRTLRLWFPSYAKTITPYILVIGSVLFWRLVLFDPAAPPYSLDAAAVGFQNDPAALLRLPLTLADYTVQATLGAWVSPLVDRFAAALRTGWPLLLVPIASALAFVYVRQSDDVRLERRSALWLAGIGLLAVVCGFAPLVVMQRVPRMFGTTNYYFLIPAGGAALMVAAGLAGLPMRTRAALAGLVVGLVVLTHLGNGELYRENWLQQREFWWQLSYRAPALAPGAVLLAERPPRDNTYTRFQEEMIFGGNFVYNFETRTPTLGGFYTADWVLEGLEQGITIKQAFRTEWFTFDSDMRRVLVITQPTADACLRVLDPANGVLPAYDPPFTMANGAQATMAEFAPYSQIREIQPVDQGASPPAAIFGSEPPRDWCYYYQRALLALQMGDAAGAAALGDEAQALKLTPRHPSEWLPFVVAYQQTDRANEAQLICATLPPDVLIDGCSQVTNSD